MKKIFIYFLSFYIALLPVQRVNAVVPAVAGVAWAIDVAAPVAVRYLASEIAIEAMVKAVGASNAYYSATAKIANSKYLSFFKSKAALGAAAFTTAVAAIGYTMSDGVIIDTSVVAEEGTYVQGKVYGTCGSLCPQTYYASVAQMATDYQKYGISDSITNLTYDITYESLNNRWTVVYTGTHNGTEKTITTRNWYQYSCEDNVPSQSPACINPEINSASDQAVDDVILSNDVVAYIESLPSDEQIQYFSAPDGVFDKSLAEDMVADDAPFMPDGQTPIPNIGEPSWKKADLIARGEAQSVDADADDYVSADDWDEAYYLANTVAEGNSRITSLNAAGAIIDDIGSNSQSSNTASTGTVTGAATTEVNVDIDTSGIETRLDINNSLTESSLNELYKLNQTSIGLQSTPNEAKAISFWKVQYPEGIAGVFSKFMDDMKSTQLFLWLDEFVLDLDSGAVPVFDMCFNTIAGIDFGCYSLSADAYIWAAIKASMILFSVIVSRRIVFGG